MRVCHLDFFEKKVHFHEVSGDQNNMKDFALLLFPLFISHDSIRIELIVNGHGICTLLHSDHGRVDT